MKLHYDPTELYKFSCNRSILLMPKTYITLKSDIESERDIQYLEYVKSYYRMKKYLSTIEPINLDRNMPLNDTQYIELINRDKKETSTLMKNLYSLSFNNYMQYFINEYIPNQKLCKTIQSKTFCKQDPVLDTYMRKYVLSSYIFNDKKSLDFYNYQRYSYLMDILTKNDLKPVMYNNNTGIMYFTFDYNQKAIKEQIIERLVNSDLTIEYIKCLVNTPIGKISKNWKIIAKDKVSTDIGDEIHYLIPNVIRQLLRTMVITLTRKKNKLSYMDLVSKILKDTTIVENYCEKVDDYGKELKVPLNTSTDSNIWQTMEATDIRKLSINDIDRSKVFDKYHDYIKLVLDSITIF